MSDSTVTRRLAAELLLAVALAAAGCGGDDTKTQPAQRGHTESTAAEDGRRVATTIVGKNIAFDPQTVTIPAREEVTITFDNQDPVPHNLHVLAGHEGDFATPVESGPRKQQLTVRIDKPGRYTFQCDVHLPGMKGTLVVA